MTIPKGGPAFPTVQQIQGMSLRDYFAAKAMQSMLMKINGVVGVNSYEYRIAEESYKFADAMIMERSK